MRALTNEATKHRSGNNQQFESPIGQKILFINLSAYILAVVLLSVETVLAFFSEYSMVQSCQLSAAVNYFYMGSQVVQMLRVFASCYMNLRYSRPFEECKKMFVLVFCDNNSLQDQLERVEASEERDRILEEHRRRRYTKRLEFYEQVANEEISRIVSGLMRADSRTSSYYIKST